MKTKTNGYEAMEVLHKTDHTTYDIVKDEVTFARVVVPEGEKGQEFLESLVRAVNSHEANIKRIEQLTAVLAETEAREMELRKTNEALLEAAKRAEFLLQQLEKKGDDFLVLKGLREAIAQAEGGK